MALILQLVAQLDIIVNFPIENNRNTFIFIKNGLRPSRQINYAEAPHCESDSIREIFTITIRPSMEDLRVHTPEKAAIHGLAFSIENAANAAHEMNLKSSLWKIQQERQILRTVCAIDTLLT